MPKKGESLGRGRKRCPACGSINAARAVTCKKCGHQFVKKAARRASARAGVSDEQAIELVLNFIREHGGVEPARKMVEDVGQLVAKVGSVERVINCFGLVSRIKESV